MGYALGACGKNFPFFFHAAANEYAFRSPHNVLGCWFGVQSL
jgi:hypothetical protein